MASGIFAILDDVAMLLDDTAAMSKVAARKTAGLLGDDLAVNAEKATGFAASRELPVIWAIARGSFINKLIILPLAFLLSSYLPWLIVPILLIGGAYLSYEGADKVLDWLGHRPRHDVAARHTDDRTNILELENGKIRSAIRTDFILSVEIVMITLGTVMQASLGVQVMVVSLIALLATIGVYGLVAVLVRMDDAGLYLVSRAGRSPRWSGRLLNWLGRLLIAALPWLIRALGVIGTIAMLLVGGGMFVHNIDSIHHALQAVPAIIAELGVGLLAGLLLSAIVRLLGAMRGRR